MKSVSSCMIIGLMVLSSAFAIADEDGSDSSSAVPMTQPLQAAPDDGKHEGPIGYDTKDVLSKFGELENTLSDAKIRNAVSADSKKVRTNLTDYVKNQDACKDREDKANTYCMESRNPNVRQFLAIAPLLMTAVSGMADACSKFGKVMDAGNKMLTAYQAMCSSWRGYCLSACGDAVKNIKDAQKNLNTMSANVRKAAEAQAAADPSRQQWYQNISNNFENGQKSYNDTYIQRELEIKKDYMSVAEKKTTCDGYAKELVSAGVGLLGVVKSYGEANNCKEKTTNTAMTTPTPVDCTIPANKQNNMTCICQDAPRTPGCASNLDNSATARSADSLRGASDGSSYTPGQASTADLGGLGGSGGTDLASKSQGQDGSSSPGAPMGGGSAGLGGSSGGGGGPGSGGAAQKAAGLNTNILAGEGGGGGGGGWGGYGSDGNNGLRQYLPGGAKDPTAMAGQAVSKEVTSQGGKSNWEKVRDRYRDNKPSLLGY